MSILNKPNWIGTPVVIKSNLAGIAIRLLVLVIVCLIVGIVASTVSGHDDVEAFSQLTVASIGLFSLIVFVAGWFFFVFFWFRGVVNMIQMIRHQSESVKINRSHRFWVPFFGWRDRDLTDEGKRYRRLAIDGFIGVLVTSVFILAAIFLSIQVEIDW